jgi:hypothetical protein
MTASAIEEIPVTFDGYDGDELICKRINVWRDYDARHKGPICTVRHGHTGVLIDRKGDGCKVRTEWMGKTYEGWVTFWFLKELKEEWQQGRKTANATQDE